MVILVEVKAWRLLDLVTTHIYPVEYKRKCYNSQQMCSLNRDQTLYFLGRDRRARMKMKTAGDILNANVMGWGGEKRKRPRARACRLSKRKN